MNTHIDKANTACIKAVECEQSSEYDKAIEYYYEAIQNLYILLGITTTVGIGDGIIEYKLFEKKNFSKLTTVIIDKITDVYGRMIKLHRSLTNNMAEYTALDQYIDNSGFVPRFETSYSGKSAIQSEDILKIVKVTRKNSFENIIGHFDIIKQLKQICNSHFVNVDEALDVRLEHKNVMILLYGPPGTGKTSLAKAVAQYVNVKMYTVKISDIFDPYVGMSEKNMDHILTVLKEKLDEDFVFFIDEIDALMKKRSDGSELANKLKIQFFVGVEEILKSSGRRVGLLFATNDFDGLDEAFTRRSTYKLFVGKPLSPNEYYDIVVFALTANRLNCTEQALNSIVDKMYKAEKSQAETVNFINQFIVYKGSIFKMRLKIESISRLSLCNYNSNYVFSMLGYKLESDNVYIVVVDNFVGTLPYKRENDKDNITVFPMIDVNDVDKLYATTI